MKRKSIVGYTIIAITVVILLFSCSKKTDKPTQTSEFIQHFLDQNSVRLYKSEIQRVKVNIFPASNMLVYSFWKQERFNMNGDLYLHLYPTDSSDLIEPRREHKFVNLPISKNGFFRGRPPYFYQFENLQLPYDLSSIQTGQYNESGKTWKSDFKDYDLVNNGSQTKQALLRGKNSLYASNIFKNESNESLSSFLGPKIYQSQEDGEVTVFFNANLNRFTYLFNGPKQDKWENKRLFIDGYKLGQKANRGVVSFDEILRFDDLGMIIYDLPLNEDFDTLEVGHEENGIETIWKSLDNRNLIYTSFPLKLKAVNTEVSYLIDNEIDVVNSLIANNLPLIYYNYENKLRLYLNENENSAYIVSDSLEGFESLKLEWVIIKDDETEIKEISLQNSFFIVGEHKQIVVVELKWSEDKKITELQINSGKKNIFMRSIQAINN